MKRGGPPGAFLAGAASRLLPASIPFRFFGAAVVFHLLGWIALLAGAPALPRFAGGPGWPLAALHLFTLGVLAMAAMGAGLQLLPVATRQPVRATGLAAALWWMAVPAVGLLALGMGLLRPALMLAGGAAIALALLGFATLLGRNLLGARGMPGVVAHGWTALAALLFVVATGLGLVGLYGGLPFVTRDVALGLHLVAGPYGFMGILVLGLSAILIPMFALADAPGERPMLAGWGLAVAALALAAAAACGIAERPLRAAAIVLGALALGAHVHLMRRAFAQGMRRDLGRSMRLVRIAWALLAMSLALALARTLQVPLPGLPVLFGLAAIGGLLTALLGFLQRILPFLASMHAGRGSKRPPTPSAFTTERALAIHFACHLLALAGLALAALLDSPALAVVASATGTAGAASFAVFFLALLRRMRSAPAPAAAAPRAA